MSGACSDKKNWNLDDCASVTGCAADSRSKHTNCKGTGTDKMQLSIIILLLCIVLQQVKAFPRGGRGGGGRGGGGRGGGGRGGWFRGGGRGGGGGGRGVYLGPSPPPSWPTWRMLPGGWTYTTASDFTSGSSSWR